jgi:hypothetical protein
MPVLAFLTSVAVISIFIIPVLLTQRHGYRRAQDYFVSSDHVLPKVIQNSSIAYAIGLATFGPFFAWGASGDFRPAILHSVLFGLGLTLLYALRRPILKFLARALSHDRSITVHEFIARRHGNDPRIRGVAAALTVFALSGLVICETLGLATVLNPLLSGSESLTHLFIAAVLVVVISCAILSGHAGIMHAAQLQLGVLYFGLFGSMTFLMYLQMSDLGSMPARGTFATALITVVCAVMYFYRRVRYVDSNSLQYRVSNIVATDRGRERLRFRLLSRFQKILNALIGVFTVLAIVVAAINLYVGGIPTIAHDSAAALQASTQVSNLLLISLVLLPLFHPIVDIVNWQRLAAFEKERDWDYFGGGEWTAAFKSFCATYAVEVPLVRLSICLFGAIAGLTLATPDRGDVGRAFITQLLAQENFVATTIVSFLLFSLFAMAVSTMSSLFAASLCTFRYDILPMFWSKSTSVQMRATEEAQAIRWTIIAGAGLGVAVFAAFYVADVGLKITFASASFLVLVFGFSSFQLAFVPLVLGPLIAGSGRRGTVSAGWALAIMGVSAVVAIGTTAAYLATEYDLLLLVLVPGCLGSGALLFLLARLWPRQTQAAT